MVVAFGADEEGVTLNFQQLIELSNQFCSSIPKTTTDLFQMTVQALKDQLNPT